MSSPSRCDIADRGTPYHNMETGQRQRDSIFDLYIFVNWGGGDMGMSLVIDIVHMLHCTCTTRTPQY